jgi:hypothetical protein
MKKQDLVTISKNNPLGFLYHFNLFILLTKKFSKKEKIVTNILFKCFLLILFDKILCCVVDPDPHHFGNPDPNPHKHQIKIRIRISIK